jgi:hypothetical protein
VCYRVPLDACGNPVSAPAAASSETTTPRQLPTPAQKPVIETKPELSKPELSKPSLGPEMTPQDSKLNKANPASEPAPLVPVPLPSKKEAAPSSSVYPQKPI